MLKFIVGVLIGLAAFFLLENVFKIPLNKTIKSVIGLERQMTEGQSRLNSTLEEFAIWIAKYIRINEYKKAQMKADIMAARLDITPEMFKANAIVKALVVGVWALPMLIISPLFAGLIAIAGAAMYYNEMKSLPGRIREKRRAIEYELPRFVFTIEKTLRHSRNIMEMFVSYAQIAGPEMKHELEITIADMRSGNYENAIVRLETRVGVPMMSDVCRGLISIMRGDDTTVYWQSLEIKFSDYQRELLKLEAQKIPKRVNRLSMVMLICFTITWVIVIGIQVVDSLSVLFT